MIAPFAGSVNVGSDRRAPAECPLDPHCAEARAIEVDPVRRRLGEELRIAADGAAEAIGGSRLAGDDEAFERDANISIDDRIRRARKLPPAEIRGEAPIRSDGNIGQLPRNFAGSPTGSLVSMSRG